VTHSTDIADRAGIAVAVACVVHCVAAPMLATSVQLAGVFASERAELAFVGLSFIISGTTVAASCLRRHAPRTVWGAFVLGASLLLCARLGFAWTVRVEQPLVIAGAAMIVAAHLANLSNCRCTKDSHACVVAE
jgi:hypothetical protein